MSNFVIETERLVLRLDTPETIRYVFEHYTMPEQIAYLGLDEASYPAQREKYKISLQRQMPMHVFYLLDKDDRQVIGFCGYFRYYPEHARAEIGYALNDDKHKRKGIMHEAIQPVIQYGFEQMGLNRLEAMVTPTNVASRRLLEKNHFVYEGVLRSHYYTGTEYDDSASYSILRKEYESR